MVCQFRVRTCANRAGTAGGRVWLRLFERAIDAGARDLPHARNSRQTITASNGGRERLAHRLDLLWAKGRLPSSAAILASSSSFSIVISPTLDFSRAISSLRSSRSRSFNAVAAPASARSRHSVSLATDTFICRATRSSGSPRNSRATIAILRCTEKRFGPFPSTPEGAPAPALEERSGAPSGLSPSSFVMCNTPVEVQFTSAGCLNYPYLTPVDYSPQAGRGEEACASRAVIVGVRVKQLLAVDLVVGDVLLPFRRDQVVDELLAELLLHVDMLGRVHQHHAILVEHALVAFDQDRKVALVLEMDPGAAVGQHVTVAGAGGIERRAHALADRFVPGAQILRRQVLLDVDAGRLPERQLGDRSGTHVA